MTSNEICDMLYQYLHNIDADKRDILLVKIARWKGLELYRSIEQNRTVHMETKDE